MNATLRGLRPGTTLIELVVTLAILGVIAGVTVLAARRIDPPRASDPRTIIVDTLRVVLAAGRAATVRIVTPRGPVWATVRVDGSVVADSLLDVERLAGVMAHAR